jgi:hypothetical protein
VDLNEIEPEYKPTVIATTAPQNHYYLCTSPQDG